MSERSSATPRPRLWQLALLLNVVFPPAGYAYVGAWRAVGLFAVLLLVAAITATELTIAFPPGMYVSGIAGVVVLALCLAVGLGVHAAWMAEDAEPKSGSRLRHTALYGLTSLGVLTMMQLFVAYWPHAFYSFGSDSMEPTLVQGDVLAVQGARALCDVAEPRPGDVALYRRDGHAEAYMHRIVAGPGQTVAMQRGALSIDGRPIVREGIAEQPVEFSRRPAIIVQETLADGARYRTIDLGPDHDLDDVAPTRLAADSWYLLGDNRDNAADSRFNGPAPGRNLCGVAFRIISSRDKSHVGARP